MKVQPRRPSGFQEYTPAEQIEFNRLLGIIRNTYEKYGFSPLDTPDIELTEVLLAGSGGETSKQVYRFKREGSDTDLTLRYDLTVPLARYISEHQHELTFPFRRYQIGKVHRAERAQAGRFREFYQCDIDVIGSRSPIVDAEFPAIINEIFESFGFGEFVVRINNRMILNGLFEGLGLADKSAEVLRIVDKMEKISAEDFKSELYSLGLDDGQAGRLSEFLAIGRGGGSDSDDLQPGNSGLAVSASNDEIISALESMKGDMPEVFGEGVDALRVVVDSLRLMGVPENRFTIDLHIARGLDYYTGTVYETFLIDHPGLGSVCSGGRYDNLTQFYTDGDYPGVGISIGLSRLFYKLREAGVVEANSQTPAEVLVAPLSAKDVEFSIKVADSLRKGGVSTLLYADDIGLGKKLKYADKMGIVKVAIIGEQERADGVVSLKNMQTGESQTVSLGDLVGFLRPSGI